MNQRTSIITTFLFLLVNFATLNAQGGSQVNCDVKIISAKSCDKPFMDPSLMEIESKLHKSPFNSFNYFAVFACHQNILETGKPAVKIQLEGGSIMNMQCVSITVNPKKKPTYSISFSIIDSSGKTVSGSQFKITQGDTIILSAGKVNDHDCLVALKFK